MAPEAGGDDNKDWLSPPEIARESQRTDWWLFKSAKFGELWARGGVRGASYRRRDDQVEKIASHLADLIGLPAARVELALRGSEEGIISKNVALIDWDLQPGNTYLSEFEGYMTCDTEPAQRPKNRVGHNLTNIGTLLDGLDGPPNSAVEEWPAFDVFVGFLVFDAWIANTDRHALNWGILSKGNELRLARSFDHGSSLGSGMSDVQIAELDNDEKVEFWCRRGMAHRFENGKKRTLVDLANEGLAQSSQLALQWLDRIRNLDRDEWVEVIGSIPEMSQEARSFTDKVLVANRKRLCDGN
jgi:hypothetical protein